MKQNNLERSDRGRQKTTHLRVNHSSLSSKLIPIAKPILPSCDWTFSSAPFPVFVGSGTDVEDVTCDAVTGVAVVGGKVRDGRLLQRELKSEVCPNDTWVSTLRMKLNRTLTFTQRFQYTNQVWFYWNNTICALLDFGVTSRSAETWDRVARIIQRWCRGTYTYTLIKRVSPCPNKDLEHFEHTWSGIG